MEIILIGAFLFALYTLAKRDLKVLTPTIVRETPQKATEQQVVVEGPKGDDLVKDLAPYVPVATSLINLLSGILVSTPEQVSGTTAAVTAAAGGAGGPQADVDPAFQSGTIDVLIEDVKDATQQPGSGVSTFGESEDVSNENEGERDTST